MTINATIRRMTPVAGNGVNRNFVFNFKVFTASDVAFTTADANGVETDRVFGVDYLVTLNPNQDTTPGGTVTYPANLADPALPAGELGVVYSAVPYTQVTSLPTGGRYEAKTVENMVDRAVALLQQVLEAQGRTLSLPVTADPGINTVLPAPVDGRVIGWGGSPVGLRNIDITTLASVIAYGNARTLVANGGLANYTLAVDPGSVHNTRVAVGGVVQTPGVDYNVVGTLLTPTTLWPVGVGNVVINYGEALPVGTQASDQVTHDPTFAFPPNTIGYVAPWVVFRGTGGNDTAGLQSAIDLAAANSMELLIVGTCRAANLSVSANFFKMRGIGNARIIKNANGPIVTVTGNSVIFENIGFRGDAATPTFTGDNVVATGELFSLLNCGSRWAYGRAVKATGNRTIIQGTCDIYQTADASSSGYDIELGVNGTSRLYHMLSNFNSSQATGGILLIDCGSAFINGVQFGKYTVDPGSGAAGGNGSIIQGCRILGNVSIGSSSAILCGNQFGAVGIVFESGTSGCRMDRSNTFQNGHTITNLGNDNNLIERVTETGGVTEIKIGDDLSDNLTAYGVTPGSITTFKAELRVANNKALRFSGTDGNAAGSLLVTASNNFQLFTAGLAQSLQVLPASGNPLVLGDGAWNGSPIRYGASVFTWIDGSTRLRIKSSAPTGDTDGTVVGTQT